MSRFHKVKIVPRAETADRPMTGATTQVYLDDQLMKGVTRVEFSIDARGIAKTIIELIPGLVEIEGLIEVTAQPDKTNNPNELGRFNPRD